MKMSKEEKDRILAGEKAISWRFIGEGARPEELFETYGKIKDLDDWPKEFSALAQRFERAADAIEDTGIKASNYLSATLYYHIAGLVLFEDSEEKKQIYYSSLRAYQKASKYFWGPAERVEFPFNNTKLPGFFRKIPGVERAPCIIQIHGADASGLVEGHYITNYFLQRGLFTFEPDLPGQYEARFAGLFMTPDFEKPISAAIDYLETRSDIDPKRIGILGASTGGFIAARAASLEKRIKVCISVGGFYGLDEFNFMPSAILHLQNDMRVTAAEWQKETKKYTLDGILDKMVCPLLVVNGKADTVQPNAQAVKIYDNAHCPKDLKLYEGANHCAWYQEKQALSYIADWTWAKLYSRVMES